MLYRIKLAHLNTRMTPSARFFHLDRITFKGAFLNKDMAFLDENAIYMEQSNARYIKKWGGPPGEENLIIPYSGAVTSI